MNYENQEWEISLKDLFFSVLNQWKKLLVTAVILAVALGGFQGYRAWRGANNPETLAQYQEEYETELEAYEQEREALERSIEDLEQIIESQNKYMEESALMQMDYHNIYEASVSLYFTTDYQIMPQMFYQDVDNTKTIVALYKTALESNGIIDAVAQEVGMETKYLNELVTITKDSDYVLQISVIHDDKDIATEIMELILANLADTQTQITDTVGEHTMSEVLRTVAPAVQAEMAEKQNAEKSQLEEYMTDYSKKVEALDALSEAPEMTVSNGNALKSAIKWACVGGVAGVMVCAVIICLLFLLGGTVYSGEEMQLRLRVKVLGSVLGSGKRPDAITRWIKRLEGRLESNSEANLEMITTNIRSYADGAKTLLITGDANEKEIVELAESLQKKLDGVNLTACGSLLRSADALRQLNSCDGVLLVEACGKSKYKNIIREMERVGDAKKPLVGCVTLD